MFNSIRWKFTTIYFVLVFIGMIISGVFIVRSFENFNLDEISVKLGKISELIQPQIELIKDLDKSADEIQTIINNNKNIGLREEIFVISVSNNRIIATSTQNLNRNAGEILDFDLIIEGMSGKEGQKTVSIDQKGILIRTMDQVRPIKSASGQVNGLLYLRSDLSEMYKTISTAKQIILQATLLACFITVILGFFVAKTITEPINDVTEKAFKMASGDFDQIVEVKSNDEIGKLAEMFNHLTKRLKISVSEISREKSKLEAIIHYMDDGLIAVNTDGNIIHLNPKAIKMLQIAPNIKHLDDIFLNIDEDLMIKNIADYNDEGIGKRSIYMGESILRVNYAPFQNDKGMKSGYVFVLQDITDQEKLDRMRREFVANVSHELKTPLTTIKSYTETILDGVVTDMDTVIEFLTVVNDEADRMARLVRDLLQLSNFDSKQVRLDLIQYDYLKLLRGAVQKLEVTAKSKRQAFKLISDCESIEGVFDRDRIEQVVLNILSNAVKYTPEGGLIKIFVSKNAEQVLLKFQDNGMGIPESDILRIFERFYRVEKARSRAMGGTGLGLSIAKHIVEVHGGTIRIDSQVDVGTTVFINIPLVADKYLP
jgi:two-component system sensor histidine kinase VicK